MKRTLQSSGWMAMLLLAAVILLAAPVARAAAPLATVSVSPVGLEWQPAGDFEKFTLTVSGPGGVTLRRELQNGAVLAFEPVGDDGKPLPDGTYAYELVATPRLDAQTRQALAAAHRAGNEAAIAKLQASGKLPGSSLAQSGFFTIHNGALLSPDVKEGRPAAPRTSKALTPITPKDVVTPDDVIIQGSACIGLDCVNNESFGFDTIRLKENNTRIKFDDTSTGTGFPNHDWQLTANDSASGGANKFSIEDITAATVPFTVTGSAPTNAIFVDSTGRVGFRTSTPVLDLHVATSNTPAMRLEQNNSGGFTAQTWDIAGNEANFFVRDVTGGSRLPFRIRPGAPTSSIDINASGNVGIGTASATQELTIKSDTANDDVIIVQRSQADNQTILRLFETTAGDGLLSLFNNLGGESFRLTGSGGPSFLSGTVGINCNAPGGFDFAIKTGTTSTTACNTGTFSGISAGQTNFTIASSRAIKTDIQPVKVPDILDKIKAVDVYTYDYIEGPKDRLGLMAEDFHQVFGRGSDKMLNGQEVEMALWLAVKELTKQNEALTQRLTELEAKQQKQQP
jgi:hypothetical protein